MTDFKEELQDILINYNHYHDIMADDLATLIHQAEIVAEKECFVYMTPNQIQNYKNHKGATFQNDPRINKDLLHQAEIRRAIAELEDVIKNNYYGMTKSQLKTLDRIEALEKEIV